METRSLRLLITAATMVLGSVAQASPAALVAPVYYAQSTGSYDVKLEVGIRGTPRRPGLFKLDIASSLTTFACRSRSAFRCTRHFHNCEDSLTLNQTDGIRALRPITVPRVHLKCSSVNVVGLGPGRLSLPTQISSRQGLPRRFAYCLPSAGVTVPGTLFFGSSTSYIFQSGPPVNVSSILTKTSMAIRTSFGNQYYTLSVKSIVVGTDPPLKLRHPLRLHISTTEPFTKLESSIYKQLRASFRRHVGYGIVNAAVPPPANVPSLDTCFNASTFGSTRVGPPVDPIELRLADDAVWVISGSNSVVAPSDGVLCLAFVDAGVKQPSVLGTFQQYDNFLEFDLQESLLFFSGLLPGMRTTCSNFLL